MYEHETIFGTMKLPTIFLLIGLEPSISELQKRFRRFLMMMQVILEPELMRAGETRYRAEPARAPQVALLCILK